MSEKLSENNHAAPAVQPKNWGIIAGTLLAAVAFTLPNFFIGTLVPLVSSLPIGRDARLFILEALVEAATLGLIVWVITKWYHQPLASIGLAAKPQAKYLGLTLLALPVYVFGSDLVTRVAAKLFTNLDFTSKQTIQFQRGQLPEMVLVFIALVLIPPFVEEVVFRGFLFRAYRLRFGFWPAALAVSLLFALAHVSVPFVPGLYVDVFVLSLFLCYLREKSGSLWPSILLHTLKNLVAFVYLYIIMAT